MAYQIIASITLSDFCLYAAHMVTNTQKYDHIIPILPFQDLKNLINLSVICHISTCVNLCPLGTHPNNLKKVSRNILLQVSLSQLKLYSDCAFSVTVPNFMEQAASGC